MTKLKKYGKLIFLFILILFVIIYFPMINRFYGDVQRLIENSGDLAPITYILLMIAAILISPIPSSPLAIVGGALFGPLLGMIYTLIGATLGAVLAFIIARFFLREYIAKKLKRNKFYQKIKGKDEKNIAHLVLITRLMPHVSFDIVSYASGLTNLNISTFALVTFIGMIPLVFLLSFFGSIIQPFLPVILLAIGALFILYFAYLILKKQ